ncbi:group III truncated hemoglobin [Maribacter polysaccharolyticus]|uniref:group III truncated hemoglobin n=1 Tax=Maribacter polysaccharolyticus TaxID=3020831 RepID=UPI00237F3607|nr:group III truncated hemoglobin [Maribacter polysaccharolyticus]MDE3742603.1 group III truncated hemoglobin [Maribacter polysaccharolyticus]
MATKTDIKDRKDVSLLVNTFYGKVRKDKILGPIFNSIIKDWDAHLELLTDFWETQFFRKGKYLGNPVTAHEKVDDMTNRTITPEHFGFWLNLWFETLDELFEGDTVYIAKNRAQKMSTMLFMQMYQHRSK